MEKKMYQCQNLGFDVAGKLMDRIAHFWDVDR